VAESAGERAALTARLGAARVSANARGSLAVLEDFGRAVRNSRAVLARPLGDLDTLVKSENSLYVSFHSQVRSGSRIPEDNDWDKGRTAAESTVHPLYHEKINYTALSLDGFGVLWWGEYSIALKEIHIARRTSVFDENPFPRGRLTEAASPSYQHGLQTTRPLPLLTGQCLGGHHCAMICERGAAFRNLFQSMGV
jgi:hypothetical protein